MPRTATVLILLASCAEEPPRVDPLLQACAALEFDRWPRDTTLYAGFDIEEHLPPDFHEAPHTDDYELLTSAELVTRTLAGEGWKVVCGVGTGTAEKTLVAFLQTLIGLAPGGVVLSREHVPGPLRVRAEDPKLLSSLCRGNIFVVFLQTQPLRDPAGLLDLWDRKISQQPPLAASLAPQIREVKPSFDPDSLKKDFRIVFTIRLKEEGGFMPAGIEIAETGKSQRYWLRSDSLHLGVIANAVGTYTVRLWVANRRQLAAVVTRKITVRPP